MLIGTRSLLNMLGKDANAVAQSLILGMKASDASTQCGSRGTPRDWAKDTFAVAKTKAYDLARTEHRSATVKRKREDGSSMLVPVDVTVLYSQYANDMLPVAREQMQKAGVRLAVFAGKSFMSFARLRACWKTKTNTSFAYRERA